MKTSTILTANPALAAVKGSSRGGNSKFRIFRGRERERGDLGGQDAKLIAGTEGFGQAAGIGMAGDGLPVSPKQLHGFLRCFVEELDAEAAESGSQQALEMRHPRLRTGVENGVAATDIGPDGVGFTDAIADGDAVAVARATAGEVVFALRKKGGEDAVLHVKHRDMLVQGELKPFRWGDAEKLKNLADIEIVAGGEPFQSFSLKKVGGEGVGDIEGEVPDHR